MRFPGGTVTKVIGLVVALVVLVGLSAAAMPRFKDWFKPDGGHDQTGEKEVSNGSARLVAGRPDTIELPREVVERLGIRTAEVTVARRDRKLELSGSLAPDTDRLLPVRSRFAGEVVEVGQIPVRESGKRTRFRNVRTGDQVQEGQLLAVVWSKDLGEKKSELIDALLRMKLDRETLRRMEKGYQEGAIPERTYREQQNALWTDQNAARRAESTLRSWRLTDAEIQAIYQEADRIAARRQKGENSREDWKHWARVEVTAPFDGTILEKNLTVGAIVDTSTNLYILGDLSNLVAWAYAYEEDLPALQALPPPVRWRIYLKAAPEAEPLSGTVSEIRPVIDTTVHAALVKGRVANPQGRLLSGQFITAVIDLPPRPDEVVVPTSALVEDGQDSVVLVQTDPKKPQFTRQHVAVVRRAQDHVSVRSRLNPDQVRRGLTPLRPGDRVGTSGVLELEGALRDLEDAHNTAEKG